MSVSGLCGTGQTAGRDRRVKLKPSHRSPGLREDCLPGNWSLVPKMLGTPGLMDRGAYMSEARRAPERHLTKRQTKPGGRPGVALAARGGCQSQQGIKSGYQGNQQRGPPTRPLIGTSVSWAWGKGVGRSVRAAERTSGRHCLSR